MSTDATPQEPQTFTEALLGKEFVNSPSLARFKAWPAEYRTTLVAVLFASLVFIPYLGSVGLWDPWETHYGEVAREMVQRNDYVHPYWESAWFFSKPAFTMWMMATGMQAAGVGPALALVLGGLLLAAAYAVFGNKRLHARLARVHAEKAKPLSEFWAALLAVPGALFVLLSVLAMATRLPWKTAGITGGDGALPMWTEWGFRLPFAGFSILAVGLMTWALTRVVSARAGLSAAFVLVTMPLYFLLSRQAVTDTPIVSATIAGIACAIVAMHDKETKARSGWWYAAYLFFAVATLAKELLGFGVPMVVFAFYWMIAKAEDSAWVFLILLGFLLGIFPGVALLLLYVHLRYRSWFDVTLKVAGLAVGVFLVVFLVTRAVAQTTGVMFMNVGGMGFPVSPTIASLLDAPFWYGLMWGSLAGWAAATVGVHVFMKKAPPGPVPDVFKQFFEMRLGTGILLFLAACLPWYYEMFTFWRVDDESKLFWYRLVIHDNFARLAQGVHTTTPGGDFTYFIQQGGYAMFPWVVLIPGALAMVGRFKLRRDSTGADHVGFIAVLWFVVSWGLIGASATKFHHYVFPMLPPMAILIGMYLDKLWTEGLDGNLATLLFGVPLLLLVGKDLAANPKDFTDLFVYNYDRPYPAFLTERVVFGTNNVKQVMGGLMVLFGGVSVLFVLFRSKVGLYTTALVGVLTFALWFNWSHWVDLSHHWTQRDQFWRYYTQRKPDEPIAAFLMNWRGETFYSRDTVKQIKDNPNVGMAQYASQPGRKWSLVEHNRLGILQQAVGPEHKVTLIDKDLNVKFVLVTIE